MKDFRSLTKHTLLHLADKTELMFSECMLSNQSFEKIKLPTQDLKINFDNTITVLPQSNESILIVWNADSTEDEQLKAWQISNKLGLNILIPNYSRSLFINIAMLEKLDFSLYKIYQNNTKVLFTKYNYNKISIYHDINQLDTNKKNQLLTEHFSNLSSSSNNFKL
ncbi:MAG: hypothetical protein KFW21_01340 [Spirochaetota bacterium]|nr:hypothetical protein [Spirochaetota bacterium]